MNMTNILASANVRNTHKNVYLIKQQNNDKTMKGLM